MNKVCIMLLTAGSLFAQTALAQGSIYFFTSIADAQKYCPPLTDSSYDLLFKPNSSVEHSAGIVSGKAQNSDLFLSTSNQELAPMNWNSQTGIINDGKFRSVDGNYGYISGSQTTCYYSYQGWTGTVVNLILQD